MLNSYLRPAVQTGPVPFGPEKTRTDQHADGDEFGVRQPVGYGAGNGEAVACSGEIVEYCFHGGDWPVFWYSIESGVPPAGYLTGGWL